MRERATTGRAPGYTVIEALAATAIVGLLVLAASPIATELLHRTAEAARDPLPVALGLEWLPRLREDLRAATALPAHAAGGIESGSGVLLLEREAGGERRLVVWRAERGLLRRSEYRARGATLERVRERSLRGAFLARIRALPAEAADETRIVRLEIDGTGRSPRRIAGLVHGWRP